MYGIDVSTRRNALLAITQRHAKRIPAIRVLHIILDAARENGWSDVIVQAQQAITRDANRAMTEQAVTFKGES